MAADPGKSGSALPPDRRSMPIVEACSGTSCKFLQNAGTFGRDQPPTASTSGPSSKVQIAGVQPAVLAAVAHCSLSSPATLPQQATSIGADLGRPPGGASSAPTSRVSNEL